MRIMAVLLAALVAWTLVCVTAEPAQAQLCSYWCAP